MDTILGWRIGKALGSGACKARVGMGTARMTKQRPSVKKNICSIAPRIKHIPGQCSVSQSRDSAHESRDSSRGRSDQGRFELFRRVSLPVIHELTSLDRCSRSRSPQCNGMKGSFWTLSRAPTCNFMKRERSKWTYSEQITDSNDVRRSFAE